MKTRLERGKIMKKNGFTLIELLAVIVILAIIALIAVPIVMNIISKANKSAFKDSAYGILKAGESYYTSELLENVEGITEDVTFTFPNNIEGLEFQGSKPIGGTMTVRKDGKISLAIHNGKHCVTKGFEDEDIQISDDVNDCRLPIKVNTLSDVILIDETATSTSTSDSPLCIEKGAFCDAGTLFTIKVNESQTYNFYVLNDDGNKVDLIMDRNLFNEVAWINAEDYGCGVAGDYCSKNDKGPLTALKVLKERTSGWTNIPAYTYTLENDADGKGGSNTYSDITGELVTNVRARLPRFEELDRHYNNGAYPTWLSENLTNSPGFSIPYRYWTSTVHSSSSDKINAWYFGYGGSQSLSFRLQTDNQHVYTSSSLAGIRPVITLSK